jgi:hypothetical protein
MAPIAISEVVATIKAAVHIAAACTIMWFFYRIANGELSFL